MLLHGGFYNGSSLLLCWYSDNPWRQSITATPWTTLNHMVTTVVHQQPRNLTIPHHQRQWWRFLHPRCFACCMAITDFPTMTSIQYIWYNSPQHIMVIPWLNQSSPEKVTYLEVPLKKQLMTTDFVAPFQRVALMNVSCIFVKIAHVSESWTTTSRHSALWQHRAVRSQMSPTIPGGTSR